MMDSGVHPVSLFPTVAVSRDALGQAGLLATGSSYLPEPSHPVTPGSGFFQVSSPDTAAGPRRILTGFPIKQILHL